MALPLKTVTMASEHISLHGNDVCDILRMTITCQNIEEQSQI